MLSEEKISTIVVTDVDESVPFGRSTPDTAIKYSEEAPPLATQEECPAIDIEFIDLTYSVPVGRNDSKILLRNISGLFKSNQLTAILGASGAGKSTLLNVLAGYKTGHCNGTILLNGRPRDINKFRKLSRYIMQDDLLQPKMTVYESMKCAADLKLGRTVSAKHKIEKVEEILNLLRLTKARNTDTSLLSGGERKRLSIALELVNDPPVIFLDEPTTGLDDVASAQCVSLLKLLANGGRTVVCSIHTPSARLFSMFDHSYIMAEGQCVFAGLGNEIVPYLSSLGLHCPVHYNPADFVIEVISNEYGNHTEKLVMAIENGRCYRWNQPVYSYKNRLTSGSEISKDASGSGSGMENENISPHMYDFNSSGWFQFNILARRMILQMWRDRNFILLKLLTYSFCGVLVGMMYSNFGNDASKTIFNFGYCFITNIAFMYIPMLPILLSFPTEVKLLKREYFNRWYGLNAYFTAMTVTRSLLQMVLCLIFIIITYTMTDQPMELPRITKFCVICLYVAIISESLAFLISAQLNVVNSVFVGPALSVPFMLLAVYGMGTGSNNIPILIRFAMYFSYLRYGLEGLIMAVYGDNRAPMICPNSESFCELTFPDELLKQVGMENVNYWIDVLALTLILILLKLICYILLRMRLSTAPSKIALSFIGRFVKAHFSLAH